MMLSLIFSAVALFLFQQAHGAAMEAVEIGDKIAQTGYFYVLSDTIWSSPTFGVNIYGVVNGVKTLEIQLDETDFTETSDYMMHYAYDVSSFIGTYTHVKVKLAGTCTPAAGGAAATKTHTGNMKLQDASLDLNTGEYGISHYNQEGTAMNNGNTRVKQQTEDSLKTVNYKDTDSTGYTEFKVGVDSYVNKFMNIIVKIVGAGEDKPVCTAASCDAAANAAEALCCCSYPEKITYAPYNAVKGKTDFTMIHYCTPDGSSNYGNDERGLIIGTNNFSLSEIGKEFLISLDGSFSGAPAFAFPAPVIDHFGSVTSVSGYVSAVDDGQLAFEANQSVASGDGTAIVALLKPSAKKRSYSKGTTSKSNPTTQTEEEDVKDPLQVIGVPRVSLVKKREQFMQTRSGSQFGHREGLLYTTHCSPGADAILTAGKDMLLVDALKAGNFDTRFDAPFCALTPHARQNNIDLYEQLSGKGDFANAIGSTIFADHHANVLHGHGGALIVSVVEDDKRKRELEEGRKEYTGQQSVEHQYSVIVNPAHGSPGKPLEIHVDTSNDELDVGFSTPRGLLSSQFKGTTELYVAGPENSYVCQVAEAGSILGVQHAWLHVVIGLGGEPSFTLGSVDNFMGDFPQTASDKYIPCF